MASVRELALEPLHPSGLSIRSPHGCPTCVAAEASSQSVRMICFSNKCARIRSCSGPAMKTHWQSIVRYGWPTGQRGMRQPWGCQRQCCLKHRQPKDCQQRPASPTSACPVHRQPLGEFHNVDKVNHARPCSDCGSMRAALPAARRLVQKYVCVLPSAYPNGLSKPTCSTALRHNLLA